MRVQHFSQLYAKASFADFCLIPIQANTVGEDMGIPFDLNKTVVKIAEVFNARRNMRFTKKRCDMDKVLMVGRL